MDKTVREYIHSLARNVEILDISSRAKTKVKSVTGMSLFQKITFGAQTVFYHVVDFGSNSFDNDFLRS